VKRRIKFWICSFGYCFVHLNWVKFAQQFCPFTLLSDRILFAISLLAQGTPLSIKYKDYSLLLSLCSFVYAVFFNLFSKRMHSPHSFYFVSWWILFLIIFFKRSKEEKQMIKVFLTLTTRFCQMLNYSFFLCS